MKYKNNNIAVSSSHVNYNKIPADINEQIEILKSRGMIIEDVDFAKKFLSENYFHRFISYSVPFFSYSDLGYNKSYRENTKFSDVVRVYQFDSKLRSLILDAVAKIEISVKTQFIHLSWKYGPHFYLEHKNFRDHKQLNDSIERIEYQVKASNDLLLDEYFSKYNSPSMPPVWIAMELVSIGQLAKWLLNLKRDEDKNDVARHFKLHYSVLQAILDNFTLIRNYSAHHARIWNRHYNFAECVIDGRSSVINKVLCTDDHRIYGVLVIITYILNIIDNGHMFLNKIIKYIEFYNIDIKAMGFPNNWQNEFYQVLHNEK